MPSIELSTDACRGCNGAGYLGLSRWNVCTLCHGSGAAPESRSVQRFCVYVVEINRLYGGPEEGGWYYNAWEVVDVREVWGWRAGMAAVRALREDWPSDPRGIYSVIGGPEYRVGCCATTADLPDAYPAERPHYE